MKSLDLVKNWLNTVSYSHSGSRQTRAMYAVHLQKFLDFVHKSPLQIFKEYERSSERKFKVIYAQYLKGLIGDLQKKGYAPSTVATIVQSIRSFFKYSDLPLGFIPSGSSLISFHNKDISRSEILEILKVSSPRDKAFFCMSAQSGLRPSTIASLKIKDLEGILEENTPIPCKITVRQENTKGKYSGYFSFMGKESVQYIKDYFKTRTKELTPESYVFTKFGHEEEPIDAAVMTHIFHRIIKTLRKRNVLDFKTEKKELAVKTKAKKPLRSFISRSEFRLSNLRKFFRKYAAQSGADYCNYWMGHTSSLGVDLHYFSKDVELHRKQYKERAMPFLRLETRTPSESELQIEELRQKLSQRDEEIQILRKKVEDLSVLEEKVAAIDPSLFRKTWEELTKETVDAVLIKIKKDGIKTEAEKKMEEKFTKKTKAAHDILEQTG